MKEAVNASVCNSPLEQKGFGEYYGGVSNAMVEELRTFRTLCPEQVLAVGPQEWRYRTVGVASPALLLIPGGELVNDLGFRFAMAISNSSYRLVYPSYPRVSSIEDLADGLVAILDAENIDRAVILGASFGGAVTQVLVRKYPSRINAMILSNTGVPLRRLIPAVWTTLSMVRMLPWSTLGRLLKGTMTKAAFLPAHKGGCGGKHQTTTRVSQAIPLQAE
jgi:pimeloyl-ACP methyl ester carboxylesterase